jgi:hypothetical protein
MHAARGSARHSNQSAVSYMQGSEPRTRSHRKNETSPLGLSRRDGDPDPAKWTSKERAMIRQSTY